MKTNKFLLFISLGLMCAAGLTSPTTRSKAATTKTTDFVIFENGAFYSNVDNHQAGSAITDGKWHNNAKWNPSRVYLTETVDLSRCVSIELTYTNVGSATWVSFGVGNAYLNESEGTLDEYDYVEAGKTFTSDGAEHTQTYSFSEFAGKAISCSWGEKTCEHSGSVLDASKVNAFSINAGNVTVNVSKIVAKIKTIEVASSELNILSDGSFYSSVKALKDSTFENGVWKNSSSSWTHNRVILNEAIDLTYYDTIEFTYTATGTWNNKPEIGIGNNPSYDEFDFVPIAQTVTLSDTNQILTINIKDYLSTQVTCSWGNTHTDRYVDISKIAGFSIKFGSSELCVTKIVAKSKFLAFAKKVQDFNLCGAEATEIQALLEEYNGFLADNAAVANYEIDVDTKLSERMDYAQYVMTSKLNNSSSGARYNTLLDNSNSSVMMVVMISGIGLLAVMAYYFIMKSKKVTK